MPAPTAAYEEYANLRPTGQGRKLAQQGAEHENTQGMTHDEKLSRMFIFPKIVQYSTVTV